MDRRVQQLHRQVQQVRVAGVDRVAERRLGPHPTLELRVLADVRGDEAGRRDEQQVLRALLVVEQLGAGNVHELDPDRALAVVLQVRRRVRARTGEAHPRREAARSREEPVPQLVRQAGQHGQLPAQHPERLGVAEPLRAAGQPVLPGERDQLVDRVLDQLLLVGQLPLLGEREVLVGAPRVLQRLQGGEQRRAQPPVEPRPVAVLGAALQPPRPEEQVAERTDREEGQHAVRVDPGWRVRGGPARPARGWTRQPRPSRGHDPPPRDRPRRERVLARCAAPGARSG